MFRLYSFDREAFSPKSLRRQHTTWGTEIASESLWGIEPQTEPQGLHSEREIIVFPDNQNFQAEFAISSSYFDIWNKTCSPYKRIIFNPLRKINSYKKMIIFYGGANICTVIIRK